MGVLEAKGFGKDAAEGVVGKIFVGVALATSEALKSSILAMTLGPQVSSIVCLKNLQNKQSIKELKHRLIIPEKKIQFSIKTLKI